MKLYYDDVLSPRRACAVARHLQSPVEFVRVELGKGEHRTPEYTLTIADFAVASPLPFANTAHIPLHEFPAIARWHEQLCELDAWREPYPELQAVA